jgi:hypothetical protein
MKAHELTHPGVSFKRFRLKNGKVFWKTAHMHGDRKRVCFTRKSQGRVFKVYVSPHTEVDVQY